MVQKNMSDPMTNTEVEDVLSSIRRLVSDDKRPDTPAAPEATPDRLVLTPALRVPDAEDDTTDPQDDVAEASEDAFELEDDTFDLQRSAPKPQNDGTGFEEDVDEPQEERTTDALRPDPRAPRPLETRQSKPFFAWDVPKDPTDEDDMELSGTDAVEDTVAETDAASELVPSAPEHDDDDPFMFRRSVARQAPAEAEAADEEDAPEVDLSALMDKASEDAPAGAREAEDAVRAEAAAPAMETEPESEPLVEDAVSADETEAMTASTASETLPEPEPEQAPERTATVAEDTVADESLSDKIAALETLIAGQADQWEPDDTGTDPYAGTDAPSIAWEDAEEEAAATPQPPRRETEVHDVYEPDPEPAPTAPVFSTDEDVLDEDALRELVSDIVREELQGALGERITRNVRKLVRREIHRALAAQDLE